MLKTVYQGKDKNEKILDVTIYIDVIIFSILFKLSFLGLYEKDIKYLKFYLRDRDKNKNNTCSF